MSPHPGDGQPGSRVNSYIDIWPLPEPRVARQIFADCAPSGPSPFLPVFASERLREQKETMVAAAAALRASSTTTAHHRRASSSVVCSGSSSDAKNMLQHRHFHDAQTRHKLRLRRLSSGGSESPDASSSSSFKGEQQQQQQQGPQEKNHISPEQHHSEFLRQASAIELGRINKNPIEAATSTTSASHHSTPARVPKPPVVAAQAANRRNELSRSSVIEMAKHEEEWREQWTRHKLLKQMASLGIEEPTTIDDGGEKSPEEESKTRNYNNIVELKPTPMEKHHPADVERFSSLHSILMARRSCRDFSKTAFIQLDDVADMCFACQGKTMEAPPVDALGHDSKPRRAAPSGGAAYPLNLYVAVAQGRVHDKQGTPIDSGLYRYESNEHVLVGPLGAKYDESHDDDAVGVLAKTSVPHDNAAFELAATHQTWIGDAAVLLLITGNHEITASKGGLYERFCDPLTLLETGMAAENALLMATALGLGACPVGALEQAAILDGFGSAFISQKEKPTLMVALGVPTTA